MTAVLLIWTFYTFILVTHIIIYSTFNMLFFNTFITYLTNFTLSFMTNILLNFASIVYLSMTVFYFPQLNWTFFTFVKMKSII